MLSTTVESRSNDLDRDLQGRYSWPRPAIPSQYYVGRTGGYGTPLENIDARDASHEYNDLGFGPAQLDKSSESYAAIRGREQQMIEYYRSRGISGNVYNGIWPNNPNRGSYLQTALDEFGTPP